MGNSTAPSRIDIDKLLEGIRYRVIPVGVANPFKNQKFHEGKFFMTPSNRFVEVQDHEPAAAEILGKKYKSNDTLIDRHSFTLAKAGWIRLIAYSETIAFSWKPSASQLRELKNLAIENHMTLIDDTNENGDIVYEPSTNESISFKDITPVDYTDNWIEDDDGLINYQIPKRHRPLREVGLPHRKANSRRILERAKRRQSRPYLNLNHG